MRLSERLELVISLVRPVESAADVGTDHGYVPVELVRRGIVRRALAMDVRRGPLLKAEENIVTAGLEEKIEARLSDGLDKLSPGEADSVIIAGMGGELMIHILEQGNHMWDFVNQWILSPHSDLYKVRRWLIRHRFPIGKEEMVFDEGKYYTVLDIGKREAGSFDADKAAKAGTGSVSGHMSEYGMEDEAGLFYGRYLIDTKNPVLLDYLKEEEKKLLSLFVRLSDAADRSKGAKKSLDEVKQKLCRNREVQHEMQGNH